MQKILRNSHTRTHAHTHTHKLEVTNEFSKVVGYKVNIQKSTAFLHTGNEQLENTFNSIHDNIKKNKLLKNKFTKRGADLCTETCKALPKEINLNK